VQTTLPVSTMMNGLAASSVLHYWPVIDQSFQKQNDALRRISLEIHDHPELAFEEHRACKILIDYLKDAGFTVEKGIADTETAFMATFTQGNGPTVSFNSVLNPSHNCER
jgi:hypothetical protein